MAGIDPGSIADWAAALFTGLGFAAAVYQLKRGRDDKKAARQHARADELEHRKSMARAVTTRSVWDHSDGKLWAETTIVNGSPYAILDVFLRYKAPTSKLFGLDTILAGETITRRDEDLGSVKLEWGALGRNDVVLTWVDAYGEVWIRTNGADLERGTQSGAPEGWQPVELS